jgi:hypothetical protein
MFSEMHKMEKFRMVVRGARGLMLLSFCWCLLLRFIGSLPLLTTRADTV